MKRLLAVLFILLLGLNLGARQYVVQWTDVIDNGYDDEANGIAIDSSGYIYVTGYTDIDTIRAILTIILIITILP